ncbi:hypothetical protein D3C81_1726550 [compost metagenome]
MGQHNTRFVQAVADPAGRQYSNGEASPAFAHNLKRYNRLKHAQIQQSNDDKAKRGCANNAVNAEYFAKQEASRKLHEYPGKHIIHGNTRFPHPQQNRVGRHHRNLENRPKRQHSYDSAAAQTGKQQSVHGIGGD